MLVKHLLSAVPTHLKLFKTVWRAQRCDRSKSIMSEKFSKVKKSYYKKASIFKKMVAEGLQFRVSSHMITSSLFALRAGNLLRFGVIFFWCCLGGSRVAQTARVGLVCPHDDYRACWLSPDDSGATHARPGGRAPLLLDLK